MVNQVSPPGDVVLVTGGTGFVGSHVVRMLIEEGRNVAEVRIFDLRPLPVNAVKADCEPQVRLSYVNGDIRNMTSLRKAFRGVDAVVHMASALDRGLSDDMEYLYAVNVTGTCNVIQACIEANVGHLVYTSSSEVLRHFCPRVNVTEQQVDATSICDVTDLVFPGYCLTKKVAEDAVLAANGRRLPSGKTLRTLSLRPCGVYGEGDDTYITGLLRTGKSFKLMPVLGSADVKMSKVYVGNVAWAHVHALNTMRLQAPEMATSGAICGVAYHITDATSKENSFVWAKPLMEMHHIKLLPISIPLWIVFYFWMLLEALVYILSPLVCIRLIANRNEMYLVATTSTYDGSRAKALLGYTPFYSAKEAYRRSASYYSKLKL